MADNESNEDENDIGPFGTNRDNLDALARHVLRRLDNEKRTQVDVTDYPELMELIMELNEWSNSAYNTDLARELGFQPSVISKFVKNKGKVQTRLARKLADRSITYMRSREARAEVKTLRRSPNSEQPQPPPSDFVVQPVAWRVVVRTPEIQDKISEVARLISELLDLTASANIPPTQRALSELERRQLIAILETALNVLRSPMVEKGLLKKTGSMVKRAAAKAAEKQVEIAFSAVGAALGAAIVELLKQL